MSEMRANDEQSARRPGPAYKWVVVGMLWFICFFNYADRMAVNAVTPMLKENFGFDNKEIGYIISAFMYVYALSAPLAGQVGDKFHRKTLILGGLYLWSLITFGTAFCNKLWKFIFVRGAEGLGETFYFPATMSLVSDYHTKKTRSRAMGLHQTSVYAGTIGGTTFAGFLAERYGWELPFLVFGFCGILLVVVLMVFLREPARNEAERFELGDAAVHTDPPTIPLRQFLRELVQTPSALLLLLAFCGANSVAMPFMAWMPLHLHENFHLNLGEAGFTATAYQQVGSAIGAAMGGLMADYARRRLAGGRILTQALGAFVAIPFVYATGMAANVVQIAVFLSCLGLAKGVYDANIWASIYDVIHPSRRATMLGIANMVGWGGGAVTTLAFGVITSDDKMPMGLALASTSVIYMFVTVLLCLAGFIYAPRDIRHAAANNAGPSEENLSH